MPTDWFILSSKDGNLTKSKAPSNFKRLDWLEAEFENLASLNPDFLGVADHLPLRLGGVLPSLDPSPCRRLTPAGTVSRCLQTNEGY
jgi:hypothetical protein